MNLNHMESFYIHYFLNIQLFRNSLNYILKLLKENEYTLPRSNSYLQNRYLGVLVNKYLIYTKNRIYHRRKL